MTDTKIRMLKASELPAAARASTPKLLTEDYVRLFRHWGYTIKLNECNDDVEVNDHPLDDITEAGITTHVRDHGITAQVGINIDHAREALLTEAAANHYHPVRGYLESLAWDGEHDHISKLAGYFTDQPNSEGRFADWFRTWIVGAVAKLYVGWQNPVLVLDAAQDAGKSYFVKWLCPLPILFYEGAIVPDDKDCKLRLMSVFCWEVKELGSTTRRADQEALKAFITTVTVRDRKPYGHRDTIKPAISNFIGTVNGASGPFLTDNSGNRRYLVSSLSKIDWDYAEQVDKDQLWAQAVHIYRTTGDEWKLTGEQRQERDAINDEYMVEDPVNIILSELVEYSGNPSDTLMTNQLLMVLSDRCREPQRAQSMSIFRLLAGDWHAGKYRAQIHGKQQRGYRGVTWTAEGERAWRFWQERHTPNIL